MDGLIEHNLGKNVTYLYILYDKLAESASAPFLAKNHAVASRQAAVFFSHNPTVATDEVDLRMLGAFDLDTGRLTLVDGGPISVAYTQYLRRIAQLSEEA